MSGEKEEQIQCLRCRRKTPNISVQNLKDSATGRRRMRCRCGVCGAEKSMFV